MFKFLFGSILQPLPMRFFLAILVYLIVVGTAITRILQAYYGTEYSSLRSGIVNLFLCGGLVVYCCIYFPWYSIDSTIRLLRDNEPISLIIIGVIVLLIDAFYAQPENPNPFKALAGLVSWIGMPIIIYVTSSSAFIAIISIILNSAVIMFLVDTKMKNDAKDEDEKGDMDEFRNEDELEETAINPEKLDYGQLIEDFECDPEGKQFLEDLLNNPSNEKDNLQKSVRGTQK